MDDRGASSTIAFLFAGVLFMAGIGAVLMSTQDVGEAAATSQTDGQILQQQALAIRDLLLYSPGHALDAEGDPADWIAAAGNGDAYAPADGLQRLGLRQLSGSALDFDKLVNLRGAPYAADGEDGYVNYEEARSSLGLDAQGFDFHVRAYPSLQTVRELLDKGIKDPNLRVTYIGDADTAAEQQVASGGSVPTVDNLACTVSPLDAKAIRVSFDVNNTGSGATQFSANVGATFGTVNSAELLEDFQRGPVVAAGDTVQLHVDFATAYGECDDISDLALDIFDTTASITEPEVTVAFAATGASGGAGHFRVDTENRYYTAGESIIVTYGGELTHTKGNTDGESMTLQVLDGAGIDVLPASVTNPVTVPGKNDDWVFDAFSLATPGTYDLVLTRGNGEKVSDRLTIAATAISEYAPVGGTPASADHDYKDSVAQEVEYLNDLVHKFCPYIYDSKLISPLAGAPTWDARCSDTGSYPHPPHSAAKGSIPHYGDILPDDNTVLKEALPDRLLHADGTPRYDIVNTLVVGSNADHHTLTANAIKGSIADWVYGGGRLVVFGSEKQVVQWLQPIFKTSISSSNGGLSAPDTEHAMLRVADDLAWDTFSHFDRAWDLKQDTGAAVEFTYVVEDQEQGAVLTISDPGAYGKGTVILTSWMPWDLFGDGTSELSSLQLVNNLLMQGYRDLFIDYGPEIPEGVVVVPADGRAQVYHPELERFITLTIRVYVFPA